jgi:hypothetical protein
MELDVPVHPSGKDMFVKERQEIARTTLLLI